MSMGPPRRRRARPVADAPVAELLARADDLAKGWLLALIEDAPLGEMPTILASELARDGPRLCAAVVRALADDTELERLRSGSALEPLAASAGGRAVAGGVEAAVRAIDALGAVIWSAVRAEVADPTADQVAELAERLAAVLEQLRGAVLRRTDGGDHGADAPPPEPAPAAALAPLQDAREPSRQHPLWLAAFEEEVERALRLGSPLSLLLAELDEADRIVAVEGTTRAEEVFGLFGRSVRGTVRRQDTLACETDTRAWIIARDTGRVGARSLAERVADAVRTSPSWRGAPVGVTIGIAVLGEDGRDSAGLIDAAEEARFLAQASGMTVAQRSDASLGVSDPHPTAG
jgi:GGDEF domain-containing protein